MFSRSRIAKPPKSDPTMGIPIVGVTGVNGAGKTLLAVESAIFAMSRGERVYSTVQIDSPWGNSTPITSIRQLLELRDCVVLIDEVAAIFSSRATATLSSHLELFLQVLRHHGIRLIWTAPSFMRAEVILREVTQAIVVSSATYAGRLVCQLRAQPVASTSPNAGWRVGYCRHCTRCHANRCVAPSLLCAHTARSVWSVRYSVRCAQTCARSSERIVPGLWGFHASAAEAFTRETRRTRYRFFRLTVVTIRTAYRRELVHGRVPAVSCIESDLHPLKTSYVTIQGGALCASRFVCTVLDT